VAGILEAAAARICAGLNASYATISRDVRDVNFSSLRSELLVERDGWRTLQTFARENLIEPVYDAWLPMAMLAVRDLRRLPQPPMDRLNYYSDIVSWEPRGWDWVDPEKDVSADMKAVRSGFSTAQEVASKRGKDYRDIYRQIAREEKERKRLGIEIDYSDRGAGGAQDAGVDPAVQGRGREGRTDVRTHRERRAGYAVDDLRGKGTLDRRAAGGLAFRREAVGRGGSGALAGGRPVCAPMWLVGEDGKEYRDTRGSVQLQPRRGRPA
jgi:hypothetical protein